MRNESAELVGSIGVTGTAERYKDEAESQRDTANDWRWIAVITGALAVLVALWAAATAGPDSDDILPFVGKLAIGAALGGLATYSAKQSGRHRDREETAKSVQLDLAAFNAFVQPLEKKEQDAERKELGRRIFGQHFVTRELKLNDGGPGALDQLAQLVADRLRSSGSLPPPPE